MCRVGQRFGMLPVATDGRADCRDRYPLFARDPAAVCALFRPAVLDALLADPGWFVEGRGNQWPLYRVNERVARGPWGPSWTAAWA